MKEFRHVGIYIFCHGFESVPGNPVEIEPFLVHRKSIGDLPAIIILDHDTQVEVGPFRDVTRAE